jgi:hypothetical protein
MYSPVMCGLRSISASLVHEYDIRGRGRRRRRGGGEEEEEEQRTSANTSAMVVCAQRQAALCAIGVVAWVRIGR